MIKKEMERFEKCRIHDFKLMFIKYLENHLEHQAKVRGIFLIGFFCLNIYICHILLVIRYRKKFMINNNYFLFKNKCLGIADCYIECYKIIKSNG